VASAVTRVRAKVEIVVAQDADENVVDFSRTDSAAEEIETALETSEGGHFELSGSEADYTLPLGKVTTIRMLYVEADGPFTIKLDGSADEITIQPKGSGLTSKLYMTANMTAAPVISNPEATALSGTYRVVGDK
jgi:hypothetical protein